MKHANVAVVLKEHTIPAFYSCYCLNPDYNKSSGCSKAPSKAGGQVLQFVFVCCLGGIALHRRIACMKKNSINPRGKKRSVSKHVALSLQMSCSVLLNDFKWKMNYFREQGPKPQWGKSLLLVTLKAFFSFLHSGTCSKAPTPFYFSCFKHFFLQY